MDAFSLKRPSLMTYLGTCGLALALGWTLRAPFGTPPPGGAPALLEDGPAGFLAAAYAGALGASVLAAVSPHGARKSRCAALIAAGALGLGWGGILSYGGIVPLLNDPETRIRALLLLAAKGAVWGGLAGAAVGMALSPLRYRGRDILWLVPVGVFLLFSRAVTPEPAGYDDMAKTLATVFFLVLAWLYTFKRDRTAGFFAGTSAIGFGLSAPIAFLFLGDRSIPAAEALWGLGGGLAWGLAAYVLDEDLAVPSPPRAPSSGRVPAALALAALATAHAQRAVSLSLPASPIVFAAGMLLVPVVLLGISLWRDTADDAAPRKFGPGGTVVLLALGGAAIHLAARIFLYNDPPVDELQIRVVGAALVLAVLAGVLDRCGRTRKALLSEKTEPSSTDSGPALPSND